MKGKAMPGWRERWEVQKTDGEVILWFCDVHIKKHAQTVPEIMQKSLLIWV